MKLSLAVVVLAVAALGADVRTANASEVGSGSSTTTAAPEAAPEAAPVAAAPRSILAADDYEAFSSAALRHRDNSTTLFQGFLDVFFFLVQDAIADLAGPFGAAQKPAVAAIVDSAVAATVEAMVGTGLVASGASAANVSVQADAVAAGEHPLAGILDGPTAAAPNGSVEAYVRHAVEAAVRAGWRARLQDGQQLDLWAGVLAGVCTDSSFRSVDCWYGAVKPVAQKVVKALWDGYIDTVHKLAGEAAAEAVAKLGEAHDAKTAASAKAAAKTAVTAAVKVQGAWRRAC